MAGCGGLGAASTPELEATEAVEQTVEAQVARLSAHPDDWFVYASCPSPEKCSVELSFNGAPGATMATDHYRVVEGHPRRVGPARVEAVLLADRVRHCTDHMLASGEAKDLLPCAAGE